MRAKKDTYHYIVNVGFKREKEVDFNTAEKKLQTDVRDTIRITNKRSQIAMYQSERMSDKFMKLASIERKKEKKRAFYAKHKNKK